MSLGFKFVLYDIPNDKEMTNMSVTSNFLWTEQRDQLFEKRQSLDLFKRYKNKIKLKIQ